MALGEAAFGAKTQAGEAIVGRLVHVRAEKTQN
jgi:hypothetical protein